MTCKQCGRPLGTEYYRTRLRGKDTFHVTCLMMLWDHGATVDRLSTKERMKELRKWSLVTRNKL